MSDHKGARLVLGALPPASHLIADRGYVLENGHVVLEDTGDALLVNEAVRSAYLGG